MKACEEYLANDKATITDPKSFRAGWRECLKWQRANEDAHCCGDIDAVGEWVDCPKNIAINEELGDEQ